MIEIFVQFHCLSSRIETTGIPTFTRHRKNFRCPKRPRSKSHLVLNGGLHFNRGRNATHGCFFLGGPIDLMARRVLAAGSQEIAEKASKHLECIDLPRD